MEDHHRLTKINNELNKLNSLIEMAATQNNALLQVLKDCHDSTTSLSSSSSASAERRSHSHSISQMFDGAESKHSVFLPDSNWTDSFDFNQCSSIIKHKSKKSSKKISNIFQQSNMSTENKEFVVQKLKQKNASAGVKKTKMQKSNVPKSKPKNLEKDKILCEHQKGTKLTRIKSQKKLLNNNKSSLKYSLNLNTISQQKTVGLKKQKLTKNTHQFVQDFENLQLEKNYASAKMETLNSKRNKAKHSSIVKKQKILYQINTMRNSNHKYQIQLQRQVYSKINGLKMKQNLCQIESNYLKVALKLTKQEIDKALVYSSQTEEDMIRFFILKTMLKFVFQIKNQSSLIFEALELNSEKSQKTVKQCQTFIKTINRLPQILWKNEQISEFALRQFREEKMFIQQKVSNRQNLTKQALFMYLQELEDFISFLVRNNLIRLSKNGQKKALCSEGFFSDRSAKGQLGTGTKENNIFVSKKKEFSQRKKESIVALKRTETAKALKKSTTAVKPRLV